MGRLRAHTAGVWKCLPRTWVLALLPPWQNGARAPPPRNRDLQEETGGLGLLHCDRLEQVPLERKIRLWDASPLRPAETLSQ